MRDPNFVILYVRSPRDSARFYTDLLGRDPVELSDTFAMFALNNDVMLGLWSRDTVAPAAQGGAGSSEIAMTVDDRAAVESLHVEWSIRGLSIAQSPTAMDFGHTFVALDPDGHRLRVFAPAEQAVAA